MALTQVDQGLLSSTAQYTGFKNRLINSAMVIDQRNAGASVTATTTSAFTYTLDRWSYYATAASKFTVQQNAGSVTPPAGFSKYLGVTSSSAYSVSSTDIFVISQAIEGYNIADLAWGTASAATVTLSFWVRSSLTGTFGGALSSGTAAQYYPFSYTVSSANTWTSVNVTIAGSTSTTWVTDNSAGLYVYFGLGVGSTKSGTAGSWGSTAVYSTTGATSVVGTNGATFYITGVQLEKGSTATSFDYRPYGTELALCQRYLPAMSRAGGSNSVLGAGMVYSTADALCTFSFPVTPRIPPTGVTVSAASHFSLLQNNTGSNACTGVSLYGSSSHSGALLLTGSSNLVIGDSTFALMNNASALIYFTGSEL